jgi:biopolymer transport protein ExbB/TolQ
MRDGREAFQPGGLERQSLPVFLAAAIIGSPVVWGCLATAAFYAAIPHLPMASAQLQRYFCSHPLEYAEVGLFCIGMSILAKRLFLLQRERRALADFATPEAAEGAELDARIATIEQTVHTAAPNLHSTLLHRRLAEACDYLKASGPAADLQSRMRDLAETAAIRLQESYSLLLTINWAVPILGFLGTVVGITLAIANVTPEQLDTSLNNVTGGLAVAFDTTTVAMSFSLVLVFTYDWVRRSEQRVLSRVDDLVDQQILPFFSTGLSGSDPLTAAQTEAARALIDRTETLVQEQTLFWKESVDSLRERWSRTLAEQHDQLAAGLSIGVDATLDAHASQLEQIRREFLAAFEAAGTHFTTALQQDLQGRQHSEAAAREHWEQVWDSVTGELAAVVEKHDERSGDAVNRLCTRVEVWQAGLERCTRAMEAQFTQLQKLSQTIQQMAGQEHELVRLQHTLSNNLEAVQAAETFESTLHNLTAAVHLLTARARQKAA